MTGWTLEIYGVSRRCRTCKRLILPGATLHQLRVKSLHKPGKVKILACSVKCREEYQLIRERELWKKENNESKN